MLPFSSKYRFKLMSIGNYYLGVTNIFYGSKSFLFQPFKKLYADEVYILNNCGDVLYLPYYNLKDKENS